MLNSIWFFMIALSVVSALATGRVGSLSTALLEGAQSAVELSLFLLGSMCAWLGFLQIAEESGLSRLLARALAPVIGRLFPEYREDTAILGKIALNLSANLLGLGNAATPLGIQAARHMSRRTPGVASDSLCMLVVCNTASIQLIPTTVAGVRAAAGCAAPFDILPAVWLASALSVTAGILASRVMARLWRVRESRKPGRRRGSWS